LCIEDLELNRVENSVKRAGRAIELTTKEFGLLEYLMRKAGQLAMAIQVAFQQMGAFDASDTKIALASPEPAPVADVQIIESLKRLQNMGRLATLQQGSFAESVDRPKMDELQKKLEDALALQIHNRAISVRPSKEGIVVSV
jgi:hypothetical protein